MFSSQLKKRESTDEAARIYAAAFENAPNGAMLLHGEVGKGAMILKANAAARQIMGREEGDLLGAWLTKSGLLISTAEEFADTLGLVERVLSGDRRKVTRERNMAAPDGSPRLLKMTISPLDPTSVGTIDGYEVHAVMHIEDITEERRVELELQYRAGHDGLTGLINRRRFTEMLIQHLAEGRRYGQDGALLMVDIDSFKRVNENYGQSSGDDLLTYAADRMRACLRGSDSVGRMGGDEFAILLPNGGVNEAEKVADKLLGAFRTGEGLPVAWEEIGLSIGITPLDGSWPDPDTAYSAAYSAMRAAKAAGGDGIAIRHGRI